MNDIIVRSLSSAGIPASKEPTGLTRRDGKRPDGLTLVPRQGGQVILLLEPQNLPPHGRRPSIPVSPEFSLYQSHLPFGDVILPFDRTGNQGGHTLEATLYTYRGSRIHTAVHLYKRMQKRAMLLLFVHRQRQQLTKPFTVMSRFAIDHVSAKVTLCEPYSFKNTHPVRSGDG